MALASLRFDQLEIRQAHLSYLQGEPVKIADALAKL